MIMVREEGDPTPEAVEYRHGLTPPMRDARRRRFRREPDLNVFQALRVSYFVMCVCVCLRKINQQTCYISRNEIYETNSFLGVIHMNS